MLPYVNDAFSDFNDMPENLMDILIDTAEHPIWPETAEVLMHFGDWMSNATEDKAFIGIIMMKNLITLSLMVCNSLIHT